jgi:DNA modification methylase
MTCLILGGDSRMHVKTLTTNSVDSIVTDPPYALTFMGKAWDNGETAFSVEFWAECLRVIKPGGHLVAFGATRGYHRLASSIEDAGFEIRDSLMWIYGTGFPKSLDVSKGIDKAAGAVREKVRVEAADVRNPKAAGGGRDGMSGATRPWIEAAQSLGYHEKDGDIPVTPQALQWDGWGTALKPAFEPIILARKPLSEKTVAANVLKWGTGAMNIDGCRVPTTDKLGGGGEKAETLGQFTNEGWRRPWMDNPEAAAVFAAKVRANVVKSEELGRWPANVVHDGSDEVVRMFPGSAARFFFSTAESDTQWLARNLPNGLANDAPECFSLQSELAVSALSSAVAQSMPRLVLKSIASSEHSISVTPSELRQISELLIETIQNFERKCSPESPPKRLSQSDNLVSIAATREQIDTITITISPSKSNGCAAAVTFNITLPNSEVGARDCGPSSARFHYSAKANKTDRAGSKHPTVKPIALMQWLCRLITPPGGIVLDPFAGSGTTGAAAQAEGMRCILIEREAEYLNDIRKRMEPHRVQMDLPVSAA